MRPDQNGKLADDNTNQASGVNEVDVNAIATAMNRSQAVIEFKPDGTILAANDNFLRTTGYSAAEIVGKHHKIFCLPEYASSAEYKAFWDKMARGEFDSGEYLRIGKNGNEIWLQATYNPIFDQNGRVTKVVKFAADITAQKNSSVENDSKIQAIQKSQAVVEFDAEGKVLAANQNFLNVLGYTLDEIKGRHHSYFCDPKVTETIEYRNFWQKLGRGEFDAGEYKRFGRDGKEVWIQASYNPIRGANGKVTKIIKFASDITKQKTLSAEAFGKINAIGKSQAVIEFKLDGTILDANQAFCDALGYTIDELRGKHHRMFVDPKVAAQPEYRQFWEKLNRGEFDSGEYKRIAKSGREVWIQASYNPIHDADGKIIKVVKFATDVTAQKIRNSEFSGKIDAIGRSQAVIEFNPDGTVLTANENFCKTLGYTLPELVGRHHRTFCDPKLVDTFEYRAFWEKLNRGEYDSGEYKRFGKGGQEVWIQATYNPIFDADGKVVKIVKFATDVTHQKVQTAEAQGKIKAISKSQAVIEFGLDGTILNANENFLNALGYSLDEVKGRHHRMFVEPKYAESLDYRKFWEKLNKGEFDAGEYKRIGRGNREVWIQASYNPIQDAEGRITKIVKYASDITEQKLKNAVYEGKVNAINKTKQALIEFDVEGKVVNANENFLSTMGYTLDEIKGRHHRMFCDSDYVNSNEYRLFWEKLTRGESEGGEYRRLAKGGGERWLNASYNPIFNADGKVIMVMKIATDITAQRKKLSDFEGHINLLEETANSLSSAATQLTSTATEMTGSAHETSQQAVGASSSADQVASGVQAVATNTEEMVASIKEIARSTNESASMSKLTSAKAQETNNTVKELGASSQEVGEVIKVISSIAQQTNLLALNATIEAARAGEAGKGFAVVANEVKELARQTAKATADITAKISAIQRNSNRAVEAIGEIAASVDKLNGISGTIAVAVEQQTATTNEVSRVVQSASRNVEDISKNVRSVSSAADKNSTAAQQTLAASSSLSELADRLKDVVKQVKAS